MKHAISCYFQNIHQHFSRERTHRLNHALQGAEACLFWGNRVPKKIPFPGKALFLAPGDEYFIVIRCHQNSSSEWEFILCCVSVRDTHNRAFNRFF